MLVHMLIEQIYIVHLLCAAHITMAANEKKKKKCLASFQRLLGDNTQLAK